MSDRPVVSVITIFLNAERFIAEAIESVFAQTYARWELLLVDDGSTDGSTEIALRYASAHPAKVRYLEHQGHVNRGMSTSRNLGLSHARGEYIALLDADDVWLPQKLEHQVTILASRPDATMVYGRSQYWRSWTGNPEDAQGDSLSALGVQPDTLVEAPALLTLWFARRKGAPPCPSDLMFRRGMAVRVGGFEDAFRGMFEDSAFLVKVCLKEAVFVAGECWDRHRLHTDSCVWVASLDPKRWLASRLFFLNWFDEYLARGGARDTEVGRAVQRALWPLRHPVLFRLSEIPRGLARRALPLPARRWVKARLDRQ